MLSILFNRFTCFLYWKLLSLRYQVDIQGIEKLTPKNLNRKSGILFLPNHPAQMDPVLLYTLLWPKFRMRPLVVEYMYRLSILRPVMKFLKALSIPNFDTAVNPIKITRAKTVIQQVGEGLKGEENFILYPASRLKSQGKEILGGSSAAHDLLQMCPDTNVVLIRTSGLWGSSFSRVWGGASPDLSHILSQGVKTLFKNLFFFTPRRKVCIEFEPNPQDLPRRGTRLQLNQFLEKWYNQYLNEHGQLQESEPLNLVPYLFWKKTLPQPTQNLKRQTNSSLPIEEATRAKIYKEIRKILNDPELPITPEMHLAIDLGMDSLNVAELAGFLAKNYDLDDLPSENLETVQTALEAAEGAKLRPISAKQKSFSTQWPHEANRPAPATATGATLPESFLAICDKMGDSIAWGDDVLGVLTYKKVKLAAFVLAQYFQTLPDSRIAVLLPATAGAFLVFFALQLAGKTPVMINWTLGSRYVEEMLKLSDTKTVITSWNFLDRAPNIDLGKAIHQIQFLEDIKANLPLKMKLRGAFLAKRSAKKILLDPEQPAVILFTSGSEANPKGVPLSHTNILSNIRALFDDCFENSLLPTDLFYAVLPPFHSFGLNACGLLTFLSGIKTAFYPDPTNSAAIADGIERWGITLIVTPPTFLTRILNTAKEGQLNSVRLFLSGAEKIPPDLWNQVEKLAPAAKLLIGYGMTECSVGISINRAAAISKTVGKILKGMECITIHPETLEPLSYGSEGEICVRGPNVFSGYLGSVPTPFIEINEKKWLRTGDIGFLDPEGFLTLSGRLKRFAKMGGEMISLGAIEEVLSQELQRRGQIPQNTQSIAVCADEEIPGKPLLVLFTIIPLEKEAANEILKQAGFSNLIKISSVRKIAEIPLMGSGKTDYKKLQGQLLKRIQ